jgi:hypothetical protein
MTSAQSCRRTLFTALIGCLLIGMAWPALAAPPEPEPALNAKGEQIRAEYAKTLETLSADVAAALPEIDEQKKTAFLEARVAVEELVQPGEDANREQILAYQTDLEQAETQVLATARALLDDVEGVLISEELDSKLMKIAILRHGTPAGLAEFAQESPEHKSLIDNLLGDEELMKMVLVAGGANGGEYGEAMEVYHSILMASEKARERGTIFHNLALGTVKPMAASTRPSSRITRPLRDRSHATCTTKRPTSTTNWTRLSRISAHGSADTSPTTRTPTKSSPGPGRCCATSAPTTSPTRTIPGGTC